MRRATMTRARDQWVHDRWVRSSFGTGGDGVEWRVDGASVALRHVGHPDEGTWTIPLAEWQAFVAAARSGQAGGTAY